MSAFVIGIGGGSAAGKTSVAEQLRGLLGPLPVDVINQDRYFRKSDELPRHEAPASGRSWPDHNHPDSFDFPRLKQDVAAARNGGEGVVIVEGILVLHDPELREMMDLKLFVDAAPDERIVRRIRRNLAWGYDLDKICDFYLDSVRYRHEEFCEPTRSEADIVIPGGHDTRPNRDELLAQVAQRVRSSLGAPRMSEGAGLK
jgi:uridine kinase